ncbi:hypothetical protein GCM10011490_23480 [Pseudoclavibacter endophyticus]|nr:hypothetical protein GCM10011490_23480 [Pseudoclavibacter endophyticus]
MCCVPIRSSRDAAMTLDRYTDLFPDDLDGVATALGALREARLLRQESDKD